MTETALGNLTADAFRAASSAAALGSADPTPFTMGVVPNGIVRDDMQRSAEGTTTFSDVFNVLPLGMSPDPTNQNAPGWPLVSAYLTAMELQQVCLIPPVIAPIFGDQVFLNISGVRCSYDEAGPDLAAVINVVHACGVALPQTAGGDEDYASTQCDTALDLADDQTLYRIVTDLYTLLLMDIVTVVLDILPKHADGTPLDLTDPLDYMAERIDIDPLTDGIQELKAWSALLSFLRLWPDSGTSLDPDLPDIPAAVYGPGGSALGRIQAHVWDE